MIHTNQRGDEIQRTEGGQPGNQNALKFDTPEARQAFCKAFCEHIRKGFSDESFTFQGSGIRVFKDYKTRFPVDFPTDMIEEAECARLQFWENIGLHGTIGAPIKVNGKEYSKFNSDSWKFNMQNRFKWRINQDVTTDGKEIKVPPMILDTQDDRQK